MGNYSADSHTHNVQIHVHIICPLIFTCMSIYLPVAMTSRLERELAEAVQEESDDDEATRATPPSSDGGDPGSDSDQERPLPFVGGTQLSSIEMSLWSLDASAASSMEASLSADTEVARKGGGGGVFLNTHHHLSLY